MGFLIPIAAVLILQGDAHSTQDNKQANQEAQKAVEKLVYSAMKAGYEKHDFKTYIAAWAEGAEVVGGRTDNDGKYRMKLSFAKLKMARKLRFSGDPLEGLTMEFETLEFKLDGSRAKLKCTNRSKYPGGHEAAEEIFHLTKTKEGWRITKNEWRPLTMKYGSMVEPRDFSDSETLEELDARVEEVRETGDRRALAKELFGAFRFKEAYEVVKEMTSEEDATSGAWAWRAFIAVLGVTPEDVIPSLRKAVELDPNGWLPFWGKAALTQDKQARGEAQKAVEKLVYSAMKAGFQKHDLKAYLAAWAEDGEMIGGRTDQDGKYRIELKFAQIKLARKLRFYSAPPADLTLEFETIDFTLDGSAATLKCRAHSEHQGGFDNVEEVYHLTKTRDGWRIKKNEWRPLEMKFGGMKEGLDFSDPEDLKELDDPVEAAREADDRRALRRALFGALRFAESYDEAKRITEGDDAKAADWSYRAYYAVWSETPGDVIPSLRKAVELDPEVWLPTWGKAALKNNPPR